MASQSRILQLILFSWFLAAGATVASQALPGCSDKCGNLSILYPFGMSESCYLNSNFLITCNQSSDPPQPLLIDSDIVVTDMTLEGQLEILNYLARDCYDASGTSVDRSESQLWASMFTISNDKNKFTAVGCDTYATVMAEREGSNNSYFTGCMSYCDKKDTLDLNDSCSGIGCCQISIPSGLKNINVSVSSYNSHSDVWDFNPCSYAFVADQTKFTFSFKSFDELANIEVLPLVLDWAIGNEPCKVAERKSDYACKQNSMCYDPENRYGYICKCKDGYHGSPYLPNGCQDIDECKNSSLHNCISERNCANTVGNYTSCSKGFHGDGRKDGTGCIPHLVNAIGISIAIGLSVLVVLVGGSWLFFIHKKRKLLNMKKKFFRQNGGLLLQQELHEREVSTETVRIFTAEELKNATKNYDESQIIGKGGYGTVYKGYLKKCTEVAFKKSKSVDQSQIKQFINEVIILSQVNHRNVVKLLGCCLETEVPLLVYEFVTNGTLSNHIHSDNKDSSISWEIRLRIAIETAQVLSYLHSASSTPIIHRDVKPTNILLDNNYTAKVSDFGASRLVPVDQTQLSTLVQGTLGYLDPEYLQTSQLTEKSDVYSFGVVLVELLTSKMALSFDGPEEERNLANHFLKSLRDDRLFQILDDRVAKGGAIEQIKVVADLAKRCLRVKGEERPTMKEVATELEGLRVMYEHPWAEVAVNLEEAPFLIGEVSIVSTDTSN